MDADRFDALSRSLTHARSRRVALASLLGGTLVLVGPANAEAKKKCPPCKKPKKGKCKGKKPDGTACPGGTCQGGSCVAAPPPCQGKDDFTDCGSGMKCSGGVCAPPAGCTNPSFCVIGGDCCSGSCFCPGGGIPPLCDFGFTGTCARSATGQRCNTGTDCFSGSCVGFKCQ